MNKNFTKAGNGVSDKYYENTEALPIYGLGQGIAWAGPAWIIASNTIVNAKKSKCIGMIFRDPITNTIVEKMQDMFVDDRAAGCNTTMENRTILQQAEHNFQDHVDLVNVTGGDIALDKCDFYHVEYVFENGEAVVVGMEKQQSKLCIKDPKSGRMVQIVQLDVDEEHETLGCYVNPIEVTLI